MTTAAIYARVSGQRQKEEQTIGSQLVECHSGSHPGGSRSPRTGSSPTRATPGPRWSAPLWSVCGTWPPRCRGRGHLLLA